MYSLTPRQQQIYANLKNNEDHRKLSVEELAEQLRIRPSTLYTHLDDMQKKGYIKRRSVIELLDGTDTEQE